MQRTPVAFAIIMLLAFTAALAAEVPNRPPEWLRERATHVVVGDVIAIYQRQVREGPWKVTRYVAEIRVKNVEKGEGLAADAIVYARYFHRSYAGPGRVADTAGHRQLAKEGEQLRIYLACKSSDGFDRENADGGYNVMFPNGFERLPAEKP